MNAIDFSRHWALTAPAPQIDSDAPATAENDDVLRPLPAPEEPGRQLMLSWFQQQLLFPDPDDPASPPTFNPNGTW